MSVFSIPKTMTELSDIYRYNDGVVYNADEDSKRNLRRWHRKRQLDGNIVLLHVSSGGDPYKGKLIAAPCTDHAEMVVDDARALSMQDRYGIDEADSKRLIEITRTYPYGRQHKVMDVAMQVIKNPPPYRLMENSINKQLLKNGYITTDISSRYALCAVTIAGRFIQRSLIYSI